MEARRGISAHASLSVREGISHREPLCIFSQRDGSILAVLFVCASAAPLSPRPSVECSVMETEGASSGGFIVCGFVLSQHPERRGSVLWETAEAQIRGAQ